MGTVYGSRELGSECRGLAPVRTTAAPGKDAFCRVWVRDPAENVRSLLLCSNDKGIRWGSRAFQG